MKYLPKQHKIARDFPPATFGLVLVQQKPFRIYFVTNKTDNAVNSTNKVSCWTFELHAAIKAINALYPKKLTC